MIFFGVVVETLISICILYDARGYHSTSHIMASKSSKSDRPGPHILIMRIMCIILHIEFMSSLFWSISI